LGWLYWEVEEGSIDADRFRVFLRNLQPYLFRTNIGVFDNAAIHKQTPEILNLIEEVFLGAYVFIRY